MSDATNPFSMTIALASGGDATFDVAMVEGTEAMSSLFQFEAEIEPGDFGRDLFASLVGRPATLHLRPRIPLPVGATTLPSTRGASAPSEDGLSVQYVPWRGRVVGERRVHGTIIGVGRAAGASTYRVVLAPPHAKLALEQSIAIHAAGARPVDVVRDLLTKRDLAIDGADDRLRTSYQTRDYCVQYRETELAFVQRILEEEGIAFHFEHDARRARLVLTDDPDAFRPLCVHDALVVDGSGFDRQEEVAFGVSEILRTAPGSVVLADRNPRKPLLDLQGATRGKPGEPGTVYDFFGRFGETTRAERLSRSRKEELDVSRHLVSIHTNCVRLLPGRVVRLGDAPVLYLIVRVEHSAHDEDGAHYSNSATLVPLAASVGDERTAFRPSRTTPRPVALGVHTATVVTRDGDAGLGASAERVDTDELGRVRVRFHWDRDGRSSHWLRVAQPWAGNGYGAFFLPRVGHEVLVSFLEGDPDHPIVIGSLHNEIARIPVASPTETIIGTRSLSGAGANELRFDDAPGAERVELRGHTTVALRAARKIVIEADEIELRSNRIHTNQEIVREDALLVMESAAAGATTNGAMGPPLDPRQEAPTLLAPVGPRSGDAPPTRTKGDAGVTQGAAASPTGESSASPSNLVALAERLALGAEAVSTALDVTKSQGDLAGALAGATKLLSGQSTRIRAPFALALAGHKLAQGDVVGGAGDIAGIGEGTILGDAASLAKAGAEIEAAKSDFTKASMAARVVATKLKGAGNDASPSRKDP